MAKLAKRLKPPPSLSLSQWADRHRRLSPESSGEPGRWSTDRAAYQRGIMDAMTDPRIERVVLMTSARVGKTQTLNNLIGYHIHQDPAAMMIVLPTEVRGEEWVTDEFDPMCRDSPALREIIGDRKSRRATDKKLHRQFPGGRLYVVGANAPSGLAAKTCRVILADEVDRFPASAGGEGDPVALAEKRATTIWNRKIVLSSTPTYAGRSRIEAAYMASDQRRYYVPCPECEAHQVMRWQQVRWDEGKPETARYHCEGCGVGWDDAQRHAAVARGEWRADAPFSGTAGFAINELNSPWVKLSQTVRGFLATLHPARDGEKPTHDINRLMVWKNTALGETFKDHGDAPAWELLADRREPYAMGECPADVLVLTAGVDVQDDRIECDVWGWREGETSWLIDHIVIEGSPRNEAPWDALAADVLRRVWPHARGGGLRIARACVDTGGRDTTRVYGHLRRLGLPSIRATKGVEGWNRAQPVAGPTFVDAEINGQKRRRGLRLWTVATATLKLDLYRRLWLARGDAATLPPGWVHLPDGIGVEWIQQLVSEELQTVALRRGGGRQEWQKVRERNEALDCAVLARAALWLSGADRYGADFWARLREEREIDAATSSVAPAVPAADASAPQLTPQFRPRWQPNSAW